MELPYDIETLIQDEVWDEANNRPFAKYIADSNTKNLGWFKWNIWGKFYDLTAIGIKEYKIICKVYGRNFENDYARAYKILLLEFNTKLPDK